ncbi:MAG: hypothetical protein Q4C18_06165, partial [Eubacteriales bacterium]|nr:hypothetical protein [Eubacteriales bacterium]
RGIYASNRESYYSYGGKSFQSRFQSNPGKGNAYGNLMEAFTRSDSVKYYNTKKGAERLRDVVTQMTGIQTARNLNDVQEAAYNQLAHLNSGKIKASDFRKHSSLKAMADDTGEGKVLYSLLATRDREGGTFRYGYNCLGIAYSNFSVSPISAEENESNSTGVTTALKGYDTLDDAKNDVKVGKSISGFTSSVDDTVTKDSFKNSSTMEQSKTLTTGESKSETMSSTVSHSEQVSFSTSQKAIFSFGKDTAFFKGGMEFEFTEGKLWENGVSDTASTEQHSSTESSVSLTLPGHTAATQSMVNSSFTDVMSYDCPVRISYTVTIFSYSGCYYDDNAATTYFTSQGYNQNGFMTQFKDAHNNLRERVDHTGDAGFDRSNGITKGIKVKHGYSRSSFDWNTPWVDHLDYREIEKKINEMGGLNYSDCIDNLTKNQPISLAGAKLERHGKGNQAFISAIIPIYTIREVTLQNPGDSNQKVKEGDSLYLRNIKMDATDVENGDFYGFKASKGTWAIVDEEGRKETSNVISLTQNSSGDYIVKGLKKGTAHVKYSVGTKAYQLFDEKTDESDPKSYVYVNPSDVETPIIDITVKKKKEKAETSKVKSGTAESNKTGGTDKAQKNSKLPEISEEEESNILKTLDCEAEQCSVAEASLYLKNSFGAQSDLNEQLYAAALKQMAEDKLKSGSTHQQYEIDAVVWALKSGLFDEMDGGMYTSTRGITELEFAELVYKGMKTFGKDVKCENVLKDYSGTENLDEFEKKAMNWVIGKGILSKDEQESHKVNPDRIMSDKEAAAFLK